MRIHLILNVALLTFSLALLRLRSWALALDKLPESCRKRSCRTPTGFRWFPTSLRLSEATGRETVGFTGHVQIQFEALQPAETITLNAHDISIVRATIDGAAARVEIDRRNQIVTLDAAAAAGCGTPCARD